MVHVCPWWLAYSFDNSIRSLFHKPEKMLGPYLKEGMTAIDIGCGMGFFSIGMAKIVGETGSVISVDLQPEMIEVVRKRAKKAGIYHRLRLHRCDKDDIGIKDRVDFALTFWMVHEVPEPQHFLKQVHSILKPGGKLLLVEPKMHTSFRRFKEIDASAGKAGLCPVEYPNIRFSRAALFGKSVSDCKES